MRRFGWVLALVPAIAAAEEWRALGGEEIAAALSGRMLAYEGATQRFHDDGRTVYAASGESWGTWRVEGDEYCSLWPPAETWSCYAVETFGDRVRFVDSRGRTTEGEYVQ